MRTRAIARRPLAANNRNLCSDSLAVLQRRLIDQRFRSGAVSRPQEQLRLKGGVGCMLLARSPLRVSEDGVASVEECGALRAAARQAFAQMAMDEPDSSMPPLIPIAEDLLGQRPFALCHALAERVHERVALAHDIGPSRLSISGSLLCRLRPPPPEVLLSDGGNPAGSAALRNYWSPHVDKANRSAEWHAP